MLLDLDQYLGHGTYQFQSAVCNSTQADLLSVSDIIRRQPVANSSQDWPQAPILKTIFFESGSLSLKTGVFLTADARVYVFSDSTLSIVNIPKTLTKEDEVQLPYTSCSDILIVNQFLLTMCSNNNSVFLDTFVLAYSDGHYKLEHYNNHTLDGVDKQGEYQMQTNNDFFCVYKKGADSIYLYKLNVVSMEIEYMSMPNMTELFNQDCLVVTVTFPFEDEVDETHYLNVLTKQHGLLILMIDTDNSGCILLDHFNIVPEDVYMGMYKEADVDSNEVRIFLVSNFFIIETQVSYSNQQTSLIVISKHLLLVQLAEVTRYEADSLYFYCMGLNIQTNTYDLYMVERTTMNRRLHIYNLTGHFITYQLNNAVVPSLKNRLRVLTYGNQTLINTYTFYSHIVNITTRQLASKTNVHCTMTFSKNATFKNLSLTVLSQDYWSLTLLNSVPVDSKYISLSNTMYLNRFVEGPAPEYTVASATSNLIGHQVLDMYKTYIDLQDGTTLKMPLLYCRLMSVDDDDAVNQQIGIIVLQDSDLKLVLYSIITIKDEVQEVSMREFSPGRRVKECTNFQQIVIVSFVDRPASVQLFSVDSTNINFIEEYEPTLLINSTNPSYHFKTIPLFPRLICIIQADKQIQLEIRRIPSKYSAFTFYKRLPETVSVFSMPDEYKEFIVDFLADGAIIGKTVGNSYHMINIDLYMGTSPRILSKHQTTDRSRIIFGMGYGYTKPLVVEVRDGRAMSFEIICLDAEPGYTFGVGKEIPGFSFKFVEQGLLYFSNGVVVIQATNEDKSYILAYKLGLNNYNSLLNIIPRTKHDYFDYIDFTSDLSDQQQSFCIPSINSSMVLTIECKVAPRLNTVMKSKSLEHIAKVKLDYTNFFQESKLQIEFSLDFIYEDIRLEARTHQYVYDPNIDVLSLESLFYGPIQSCTIHDQPIGYLNEISSKQFRINDMCEHLSDNYRKKVNSKSWVLLLCSSGVYVIENNNNNTTKFSNDTLFNVWGNPVRQFETLDKWVIVGVGEDGFKTFLKETAGWKGSFKPFELVEDDNSAFKYDITSDKSILEWFVFYDIDRQLKLDFVLFRGFTNREAVDRTIGIYICRNESQDTMHRKIYEITAKDVNLSRLDASNINVSCVKYSCTQSYHLVMTFQSSNRYIMVIHMTLTNVGITIDSMGQIDMGEIIKQTAVIPHRTELLQYETVAISEQSCSIIVTSDFVIVGATINLTSFEAVLNTVYSDYMGCKNQEMAKQFGSLVILTCKFEHEDDTYIKAYHKYNNSIVNITQFMRLPAEIKGKDYIDKIGYAYNVLEYGLLSQSPPLFDTNFTYHYIRINLSLVPVQSQHFAPAELCCNNQFNRKCIIIIEDISNQTAFWLLIFAPICISVLMLVGGIVYIKNYKQQMIHWAEQCHRQHMKHN